MDVDSSAKADYMTKITLQKPDFVNYKQVYLLHLWVTVGGKKLHIELVGNPNSGKSSLFNCLTGMNQKVGNFPGVTVEKKTGSSQLLSGDAEIIDLPGSYSLYPRRLDEWVSYKVLLKQDSDIKADIVIAVADASNLKRNLLFCTQLIDLKTPVIVALTMLDIAHKKGISIDIPE